MGWSDILGTVGSIAGAAGGLLGGAEGWLGTVGKIASGVSGAANLGGQIIAANQSQGMQDTATQGVTQALGSSLTQSRQEAKRQKELYDKAMDLIPQQTEAYTKALEALGPASKAPAFDPNAIEARASQLLPEYMSMSDREMERMFGNNMGSLMASGVDDSTGGIQARAALGAKSADVHREAYNRAYSEALGYATSIYNLQDKTHTQQMLDRTAALKEATDPFTTAYGDYAGLLKGSGADFSDVGTLSDLLSKYAGVGTQSAATGTATSNMKQSFGDFLSGMKDIFGGSGGTSGSTALPIYGDDATGGSMGGHI
jgi:hypothetical protein